MRRKLRASRSSPNGLAMISSSRLAATPRQLGSSAPRKAKSVSTAKVLRERIKRNDDERLPRLLDCRKWKTTARPRKTLRQPETTTGQRKTRARAGGNEPGTTRGRATARPQKLRRGPARPQPTRGHESLTQKARKFSARNICPSLDSRSKTDLETQRTEKKAFRARAGSAQSARQGGTEPGTTRFKDGRATTGPPAPRRGPGAPTAQPRPRGPDLESAQISRGAKFAILAPNLDVNNETDLEACGTRAELKRKSQESPLQAHPL